MAISAYTDGIGGAAVAAGALALTAGLANMKLDKVSKLFQKALIIGGSTAIVGGVATALGGRVVEGVGTFAGV